LRTRQRSGGAFRQGRRKIRADRRDTLSLFTITGEIVFVAQPAVADFDGDGNLDIVLLAGEINDDASDKSRTTNANGYLLRGTGDGTFQSPETIAAFDGMIAVSFATADFNGDGKADLAALAAVDGASGDANGITLVIALGRGDGTFQVAQTYASNFSLDLTAGDVNGDGIPNLVVSGLYFPDSGDLKNASAGAGVYMGKGDGSFKLAGSYSFEDEGFSQTCVWPMCWGRESRTLWPPIGPVSRAAIS
jgi:hypothetical protein